MAELLSRISSRELSEWMAYYDLEPFGEERADLRAGIIASVTANANRDAKKGKAYRPQDFMPDFEKASEKRQVWAQGRPAEHLLAKVRSLNALFGGKDERGEGK